MRRAGVFLFGLAVFIACGGSDITGPADFDFAFSDPAGDTASVPTASGAVDLVGLSGTLGSNMLVVRLKFTTQVTPWSEHKVNALDGFLDLDLDRDPTTPGGLTLLGGGPDSLDLGPDVYLDLRDNGGGKVALLQPGSGRQRLTLVTAHFTGDQVSFDIPRTALAGFTGDSLWAGVVVGNRDRTITDLAPNQGHFVIGRP